MAGRSVRTRACRRASPCCGRSRSPTISMRATARARGAIAIASSIVRCARRWMRVVRPGSAFRSMSTRCAPPLPALIGEHDFTAFRTVACQAKSASRNVREIAIARAGEDVIDRDRSERVPASHGAQHRRFAAADRSRRRAARMARRSARGPRPRQRRPTAPAAGLTFLGPRYPASWNLPAEVTL